MAIKFLNTVQVDTDVLYVDASSNEVGIGTDDPGAKLEVVGTTGVIIDSGSNSAAKLTLIGDASDYGGGGTIDIIGGPLDYMAYNLNLKRSPNTPEAYNQYWMANSRWTWDGNIGATRAQPYTSYDFKTQGSSQMVIYNNNVGIGTTNPSSQLSSSRVLDISSTGNSEVILDHTDAGATSDLGLYSWNRNNDHLAHVKASCDGATDSAFISFHAQATGGSFSGPGSNERMRIKSNGNVGIGTTQPSVELQVGNFGGTETPEIIVAGGTSSQIQLNTTSATGSFAQVGFGGTQFANSNTAGKIKYTHTSQASPLSDIMSFRVNYSDRMVINGSGNVGIGTTNPGTYKLAVAGSTGIGGNVEVSDGLSGDRVLSLTANSGYFSIGDIDGLGDQAFISGDSSSISISTNQITTLHCDSNNRVGIGTDDPNAKLEVAGSTRITGSGLDVGYGNNGTNYVQVGYGRTTNGYAYIDLIGDSTYSDYGLRILRNNTGPNADTDIIHRGTGDLDFKTVEAGDIGFFTASTQKMIVKSGGNVGIGTTNPTSAKLVVAGDIDVWSSTNTLLRSSHNGSYGSLQTFTNSAYGILALNPGGGNVGIGTTNPGTYKLDVAGTGRFTSTVTATNFILSSDETLKNNIKEIDTKHVDVDWKNFELKSEPGIKRAGVIAQELEIKHPEFVRTADDGLKSVAYIDLLITKIAELEARLEKLEK